MSTPRLLAWIALVAGAELAVRGHLAAHTLACHGGALLFAWACVALYRATRARRFAVGLAIAWSALVLADAGLARWARGRVAPASASPAPFHADPQGPRRAGGPAPLLAPPPPDAFAILALGGATTAATSAGDPAWPSLLETAIRERFSCERSVFVMNGGHPEAPLGRGAAALEALGETTRPDLVLVLAGPALLDVVLAEDATLRFAPAPEIGARASVLGAALEREWRRSRTERRWREALAAEATGDPRASAVAARYRALLTAARRRGAEVRLVLPPLALDAESPPALFSFYERRHPDARSRVLAGRAHARIARSVAGAYGARVIDARPGLEGEGPRAFLDLAIPSPVGRWKLADAVLADLSDRLARRPPGCAARRDGR